MSSGECLRTIMPPPIDCLDSHAIALREEILKRAFPTGEKEFTPNIVFQDVPLVMTVCLFGPAEEAALNLNRTNGRRLGQLETSDTYRNYVALAIDQKNVLRLACRLPDFIKHYPSLHKDDNRHEDRTTFGILYLAVMGFVEPMSPVLQQDIQHVKAKLGR